MATINALNNDLSSCTGLPLDGGVTGELQVLNGGTGLAIGTGELLDGQLLIGKTSTNGFAVAALTAGSNISITNGDGAITIASTAAAAVTWNDVTSTSATMAANNGYVNNSSSLLTLTLPTTAAFGSVISIIGRGANGFRVAQNSGQSIQLGTVSTTIGTGGSIGSGNRYDSLTLICVVANTTWQILGGAQSTGLDYV